MNPYLLYYLSFVPWPKNPLVLVFHLLINLQMLLLWQEKCELHFDWKKMLLATMKFELVFSFSMNSVQEIQSFITCGIWLGETWNSDWSNRKVHFPNCIFKKMYWRSRYHYHFELCRFLKHIVFEVCDKWHNRKWFSSRKDSPTEFYQIKGTVSDKKNRQITLEIK